MTESHWPDLHAYIREAAATFAEQIFERAIENLLHDPHGVRPDSTRRIAERPGAGPCNVCFSTPIVPLKGLCGHVTFR